MPLRRQLQLRLSQVSQKVLERVLKKLEILLKNFWVKVKLKRVLLLYLLQLLLVLEQQYCQEHQVVL